MKFAEGLVSSLLLSLPPSRLPVRLPLLSVPLAPLPPGPFTTPSKSLFSLLLLLSSSNHQLPRHYGIANLPDLLQVIFAQNRFNSNLGIRLFLLYVSGIPPPPSYITSTYVDCAYVCMLSVRVRLACARSDGARQWMWKVQEDVSSSKFVVESSTNYR